MIYNLIVTEIAELHAFNAAVYYQSQQPGLNERFLFELEAAYKKITEHPQYYSFIAAQDIYRDICLDKFPYVIIYQLYDNDVIVIDVFNTHREKFVLFLIPSTSALQKSFSAISQLTFHSRYRVSGDISISSFQDTKPIVT